MNRTFQLLSLFLLLTLVSITNVCAQSGYQVKHFSKQDYKAGNQNWSVDADHDGYLYIGNNDGLLVYDGTHWKTFRNPDQTIVRSVYVSKDQKIYTGSYEEFGFWQREKNSNLVYHSLKHLLKGVMFRNSEIWKIVENNGKIYFQSFSSLFVYDGNTVKSIGLHGSVIFLLKARNRLFIQSVLGDFYEIIQDQLHRIDLEGKLAGKEVKTMLPCGDRSFLIGTTAHGLFLFDGDRNIVPFATEADEFLRKYQINNGIVQNDKIILGTIVNGLMILDLQGKLVEHLHSGNALQNNTVLSLCTASDGTIWAGLDRGIENLSPSSLINIYQEKREELGSVYTAALKEGLLYVGTNRGIFMYRDDRISGKFLFSGFLENSQGQVWELKIIDGTLFCGHTTGTYTVNANGMTRISNVSGGYSLQAFQKEGFSGLIQCTYSPLAIYGKEGNAWKYLYQIKGFQEPSHYLETDHLGNIWVGHTVNGLYKLRLSDGLDSVVSSVLLGKKDGFPSDFNLRVFKVGNRVVFTTGKLLYTWDDLKNKLILYDDLNTRLNGFESSNQIVNAGNNLYWFIRKNDLGLFEIRENAVKPIFNLRLPLYSINMVDGYENLVPLDPQRSLLCLDDGFAIINNGLIKQASTDSTRLVFRDIQLTDREGNKKVLSRTDFPMTVSNNWNTVSFYYTAINNPYLNKLYQYKLLGIDKDWSEWTGNGEVTYSRLPKGHYKFMARTYTGSGQPTTPIVLIFKVDPAWYAGTFAYILYFLVFSGIILWSWYLFRRRVIRHHERLHKESESQSLMEKQQAEKEIINLQNEKLQAEISHKNIQLADSTMAIIKKNELLIEIKEEVSRQKELKGPRSAERNFDRLMSLINQNISSDSDWKVFEELFDQAHENFFKRLKTAYPDLTQSDLKLCAYLRLNLSSKEIAPLLNITFRGVETRRYRLRRRVGLESDANLVEFIMQF